MKSKKTIKLIPIAAALITLAASGCASTRTQKSAGETLDDGAITAEVKTALIANSDTQARNINVDTRRGVVQLNGFVETSKDSQAATEVARKVKGVQSVRNNLALKGAERTAGTVIDDGVITTKVKLALVESPVTKAYEIKVETHSGTVQLGGWVGAADARTEASRLAHSVEGVLTVQNNLEIKK